MIVFLISLVQIIIGTADGKLERIPVDSASYWKCRVSGKCGFPVCHSMSHATSIVLNPVFYESST